MSKAFLEDPASRPMALAVYPKRPSPGQPQISLLGAGPLMSPSFIAGAYLAMHSVLAARLWRRQTFLPFPSEAGWWINHRLHCCPTQSHVQETQDTRKTKPSSPQPAGPSIILIMAEGIPVPWRNELGVFQAPCLIKCFYSITLQLQGAVMGICSSDLLISARTIAHMAQWDPAIVWAGKNPQNNIKSGVVKSLAFRESSEFFVILRRSPRGKLN